MLREAAAPSVFFRKGLSNALLEDSSRFRDAAGNDALTMRLAGFSTTGDFRTADPTYDDYEVALPNLKTAP